MRLRLSVFAPLLFVSIPLISPAAASAQRWTAVDVGSGHACALDSGGRAFCWGYNHNGQLGARTPEECGPGHHGRECWSGESDRPLAVGGGLRFTAISAGGTRSCGLVRGGRAFCWGEEIGSESKGCAHAHTCSFAPLPFAPEVRFRTLHLGEDSVCGVTIEGRARCWRMYGGRRSDETYFAAERVREVRSHSDLGWNPLDACAVAVDGRAFCAGRNRVAQLGAGDVDAHPGGAAVATAVRFTTVQPAGDYACGLAVDGAAHCWGQSAKGEIAWGDRDPADPAKCGGWRCARTPRPVAAGLRFRSLALGPDDRFCGLTAGGEVHCWGVDGQASPGAEGRRFRMIEGGDEAFCGIALDGGIYCWERLNEDDPGAVRVPDPAR
jgi:alpha-tubulin suppressor-like RCC1 family protein